MTVSRWSTVSAWIGPSCIPACDAGPVPVVAKAEDAVTTGGGSGAARGVVSPDLRQLSVPVLRALATIWARRCAAGGRGRPAGGHRGDRPHPGPYQLAFHEGSRYPLDRGAAGIALLASLPPRPDERDLVVSAREQGWVITHGEIEPNTYGLAVPVHRDPPSPPACINLISHREDVVMRGKDAVVKAAKELSAILS